MFIGCDILLVDMKKGFLNLHFTANLLEVGLEGWQWALDIEIR